MSTLREMLEKFSNDLDALRPTLPRQALEAMDYFRRSLDDILAEAALRAETPARESRASTFGDEWTHLQWLKALGYETCVGTSPFDSFGDIETAIHESPKLARAETPAPREPGMERLIEAARLIDLLSEQSGEPCDGFRFREGVAEIRAALKDLGREPYRAAGEPEQAK